LTGGELRVRFAEACRAWLSKSPSIDTRTNYARDVNQFLTFLGVSASEPERLACVTPGHVAAWRDHLHARGLTNASIRRKMTALRSLYSYLNSPGFAGANPAHGDFVDAPALARNGKTVALAPNDCRRFLDAPDPETPQGLRDRALLAVPARSVLTR
jgi:integrase/recombinase XerD